MHKRRRRDRFGVTHHGYVTNVIRAVILELQESPNGVHISAGLVGERAFKRLRTRDDHLNVHLQWVSVQGCTYYARKELAAKLNPTSDESDAYQGNLFAGKLQTHYPVLQRVEHDDGSVTTEHVYIPLEQCTDAQIDWNVANMSRAARGLVEHVDALMAYKTSRRA